MPRTTFCIPANHRTALEHLTETRGQPGNRPAKAELLREAVSQYLAQHEDLPEEVAELLDDDLLANAGGEDAEEVDA